MVAFMVAFMVAATVGAARAIGRPRLGAVAGAAQLFSGKTKICPG